MHASACGAIKVSVADIVDDLFQFTPLREGRSLPPGTPSLPANFNSRPCVRGDGQPLRTDMDIAYFNSRPCVRGDSLPGRI